MSETEKPEFWIDVGGTFTDCILHRPGEPLQRHKTLSSGVVQGAAGPNSTSDTLHAETLPRRSQDTWLGYHCRVEFSDRGSETRRVVADDGECLYFDRPFENRPDGRSRFLLTTGEHAPIVAIRFLLDLPADQPIPTVDVRLGTTRGTNALLTRTGAPVGLVTTLGFADGLEIGHQNRPRLFDLNVRKPTLLYRYVGEIDERMDKDGRIVRPLRRTDVVRCLRRLREQGIRSLAISFLHSFRNPQHEKEVAAVAREMGFEHVTASHDVSATLGWVARSDTSVVDAYLSPVLQDYLDEIRRCLGDGSTLRLLTSAGTLVSPSSFTGKDSVLSGPAGGVVGYATAATTAGFDKAIGFDMGGTSTDVSRYDGDYEIQHETEKAGVRIVTPMMAIETVAAGGGSICHFDGIRMSVGPDSAGADPGPACYGRGGPLTVTDVNLALGKLAATQLPFELDQDAVTQRLQKMCDELSRAGHDYEPLKLADGLLRIANQNIVEAIRTVSVSKGVDPSDYVLAAFGGAAGQHACAVARALNIRRVLLHPDSGVLSAWGIGAAKLTQRAQRAVYQRASQCHRQVVDWMAELSVQARGHLEREWCETTGESALPSTGVHLRCRARARYLGTESYLNVDLGRASEDASEEEGWGTRIADTFHAMHERRYGYTRDLEVEIVSLSCSAELQSAHDIPKSRRVREVDRETSTVDRAVATVDVAFDAIPMTTAIVYREELQPGDCVVGPALITEQNATTVVDPGWRAEMMSAGELLLEWDDEAGEPSEAVSRETKDRKSAADPIQLEIVHNRFASIAEQMGVALRDTALSVNVKERLDFSCALFTRDGDLIANAPHVPVHLGAMSQTVRAVLRAFPRISNGDAFVSNDPYDGGSHLPDVTVVNPVFASKASPAPDFFVASRAHHAEIGGVVPGSMPPTSTCLEEEGVLLSNLRFVEAGRPNWQRLRERLEAARYPTRNVQDNVTDIAAQLAANNRGISAIQSMVDTYGTEATRAYAQHVIDASAKKMRVALASVPNGVREFSDQLDCGATIVVRAEFQGEEVLLDFSGTSSTLPGNLNANEAITTAAVMYCLRLFLDHDVPLNQGVLEPVRLKIPRGTLLSPLRAADPARSPAVAAGNVETSQRIVDVVLGAFGLAAASQGTMNNLTFGNAQFGYYETIGGGAGATPDGPGASAVHTHMTNTRLTDPEVLEARTPVRLRQFSVRWGSGGSGVHPGGNGMIREIEFLEPLHVALISNRREPFAAYGLDGGGPGASGRNMLIRCGEESGTDLGATAQLDVEPGDRLRVETPGGGGWGSSEDVEASEDEV